MKNLKKKLAYFKRVIEYRFDIFASKGTAAQFVILVSVVMLFICVFGLILSLVSSELSFVEGVWHSLMHTIDQGTITGDETDDYSYIVLMLITTFFGLGIMGTIIGIINNSISNKLEEQKKGHSKIIEQNHLVIIGYNQNIHTIIDEMEI